MQLVSGALYMGLCALSMAACVPPDLDHDERSYSSAPPPFVLCSASVDDKYHVPAFEMEGGLVHAHDASSIIHFYAHDPGRTVSRDTIEDILMTASSLGLPFVTYDELDHHGRNGGLALSFDDNSVADWTSIRPLLARYHARVTFFVTRYLGMTDDERAQLHQLAADGHDIEYHTTAHLNAVDYVVAHGLDAYIAHEIEPALTAMRDDGFPTRELAYPFGAHNAVIDAALEPYFDHVRAIRSTCPRHR